MNVFLAPGEGLEMRWRRYSPVCLRVRLSTCCTCRTAIERPFLRTSQGYPIAHGRGMRHYPEIRPTIKTVFSFLLCPQRVISTHNVSSELNQHYRHPAVNPWFIYLLVYLFIYFNCQQHMMGNISVTGVGLLFIYGIWFLVPDDPTKTLIWPLLVITILSRTAIIPSLWQKGQHFSLVYSHQSRLVLFIIHDTNVENAHCIYLFTDLGYFLREQNH